MVDDPVFSTHLGEFIVNLQSGLGSITAGVTTPGGSLLLTSNDTVLPRAEGRVLLFNYVRGPFSSNDDQRLDRDLKALVNENAAWEDNITTLFGIVKDALSEVLPEMQPRWLKGMTTVIRTYAIALGWLNPAVNVSVCGKFCSRSRHTDICGG
ncbi:uncharacterized protein LOC141860036 isoform X1 [Acropora palmata]|uniref:uncharacterized protein LOC141860036 isoform X1 n=1 Tax=Acropora palmata TaxID=6131 RepID=UPI003DA1C0AE